MLIKTAEQIAKMRVACRMAAQVLEMIEPHVKPGVNTANLDKICHQYIVEELKAIPATLNHRGFPASICTSLNHVVCHGIPAENKILKEGDILNIDVTVKKDEFIGDTSKMFLIGKVKSFAERLVKAAQECMYAGINQVRPDAFIGDISHAIAKQAKKYNYTVVHEYGGHGIGQMMWEDPHIPNFGEPNTGLKLQSGMIFTIEPMVNQGKRHIRQLGDGWTIITKDRSLSAQWEHTVLVTNEGVEILTLRKEETEKLCRVF
jgi:methionyl aminopeptidase